ncbi:MAG: VOC family protein [Spirochaetales bacterium]
MNQHISGIQQIGVGVPDAEEAWTWYRHAFGFDVPILNSEGVAEQMLAYTGNQPVRRHAVLALNLNGGAGAEIWQLKEREPVPASFNVRLGDLGINAGKIKSRDVAQTRRHLIDSGLASAGDIRHDPAGRAHFFVSDPGGNLWQVTDFDSWFAKARRYSTGGVIGALIGVSDMETALSFYRDLLGYETVVYDTEGQFSDLDPLPGGAGRVRRVLLTSHGARNGAFSRLLGRGEIELVSSLDFKPSKIFEGRWWGDLGFIHICFDVTSMQEAREACVRGGHPFTAESDPEFEMGEADGQFAYIEDPDGTLIEFVETNRIPVLKKIGWYLDLRKRDKKRPLPDFILKALRFARQK